MLRRKRLAIRNMLGFCAIALEVTKGNNICFALEPALNYGEKRAEYRGNTSVFSVVDHEDVTSPCVIAQSLDDPLFGSAPRVAGTGGESR